MGRTATNRARARKVALTQRDTALMEELVLRRAEHIGELHRLFFPGLSRKRVVNRLAELVGAGYLHKVRCVPFGSTEEISAYTLGPRARAALERRSLSSEHFRFRRWNPTLRDSSVPHQLVVNKVVWLLRTRAVPEHLLPVTEKAGARHRPDALLVERPGGPFSATQFVALEVDLGHYSRERIIGKINTFRALPETSHMLIVVPDERRRAIVRGWVRAEFPYAGGPERHVTVRTLDEVHSYYASDILEYEGEAPFLPIELIDEDAPEFGLATFGGPRP